MGSKYKNTYMNKEIILTQEGLEKLKRELSRLQTVKRPSVIERIQAARSLGDLSENSEYDDARNEQSFVEGRIQELQDMIKKAKVVSKKSNNSEAGLGSTVVCEVEKDKESYELVSSAEADPGSGKISIDSPLGKGLMGRKKGEIAIIKTPGGEISYKILDLK